ncbi:sulfatase-like hydrolase/transferase [Vannielia litorea]|uniref:Arylsulfatase A n=1 Tax=Vannielia litorea TaxID=1217970 RepID=A0A1N6DZX0_9RHOB|nr:sulfatase-like hydrolase/transferase [Vannielia litorea]SIN76302.1 Arylsulfatase A [Vannielia litorea]
MARQNIILFLTDQWRWDTLNEAGHPAILPNLRAFRAEATNFENAFTTVPLCTPARASLFTGRLPHQHGTTDNVQGKSFYPHGKLHPKQTTYLERLRDAGYNVAFVGKWHLGDGTILDRGIEDVVLSDGGDTPLTAASDVSFAEPRKSPYYGTITDGEPLDGIRVARAIEMLPRLAASDQPFCLVVSLHAPHFPHHVPAEFVALYDDLPADYVPKNWCRQFAEPGKPLAQSRPWHAVHDTAHMSAEDWRRTAQHYWGFCSYTDALFGRFRAAMTEAGLDESTLLAFTSDHGEMLGAHGWFDKGPFFYEEVMRIPMMVRQPGVAGGETRRNFVSFHDLFPTLIERAGAETLLDAAERERSYWRSDNDAAFYTYDAYQGRQFRFRGIRETRYKYAWSPHDLEELYDLDADPGERRNLASEPTHQVIGQRLKARLFDWMTRENDWLSGPGSHPPVGSYVDGRDAGEQHQHPQG